MDFMPLYISKEYTDVVLPAAKMRLRNLKYY